MISPSGCVPALWECTMHQTGSRNMETLNEQQIITAFLREIGIDVQFAPIEEVTFLPGLTIRDGGIVVDATKLLYPGDLLHEAGHLAVMTAEARTEVSAPIEGDIGMEIAAIAWSWA